MMMAPVCTSVAGLGLPSWSCLGAHHASNRACHRLFGRETASRRHMAPRVCRQASETSASYSNGAGVGSAEQARQRDVIREQMAQRAKQLPDLLQEIGQTMISNGPKGAVRALQAATAVAVVGSEYLASVQRGTPQAPPLVLRKLFTQLGSTYIKLGQFVASSPTLFPPEYVLEFQQCLDSAPPVPWDVIKRTIEQELQGSLEETFSYVNRVPLATASVAQVHEAILRASNKEVVIKVLKPGVEDVLTTDLSFLYLTVKVLQFINPELERASLVDIVGDIRDAMTDEVDFLKEAKNIADFQSYVDRAGLSAVAVAPYVYTQHSSRRVLVMEKLTGVPLTDLDAIRSVTAADPSAVLVNALNTWFGTVMGASSFHADVHAGNLLVLEDGRVGFIDFGIVGRINPVIWQALQSAMVATASNDFDMLARALATVGATSTDVDISAFASDLRRLFTDIESLDPEMIVDVSRGTVTATAVVGDESLNRVLLQLVAVADTHGVRFPRVFGILIKQFLYFDRYTKILAPELQVLSDDRLILRDAMNL